LCQGYAGRQRIGELACDRKDAANLCRPTSPFAKQGRYPGFICKKVLKSLCAVANAITGTNWNGFAFDAAASAGIWQQRLPEAPMALGGSQ
jgi:hypothetical protein